MSDKQTSLSEGRYSSDVIVDVIKALGIEYVAFNPGATFRGLHDSLVNYGGNRNPEVIFCCNEEIAVDIASGYAKATGKPMAVIVHNIVGLLQAAMAIFNAWVDRTPVLVLGGVGPIDVEKRRHWIDWIHSSVYQGAVVKDYVKWDEQASSLPSAIDALLRGYQLANTSPKGPVYLCFDSSQQEGEVSQPVDIPDVSRYLAPSPVQGDPEALNKAAGLLVKAERPVVMANHLSREPGAVETLVKLAELLSLPVIDCGDMVSFPNTHPLDLTGVEKELLSQADLVLCINVSDLGQALSAFSRERGAAPLPGQGKIVDISLRHFSMRSWVHDFGRLVPVDMSISASPSLALQSLVERCEELLVQNPQRKAGYQKRFARLKARHDDVRRSWLEAAEKARDERPISVSRLHNELWQVIKNEDWVLAHQGLSTWARKLWDWDLPYRYVGSMMGAGLGYGIGTSLGVALANEPLNRLCIDFQPDGDFLFNTGALWTAAHHHIPLLVVMYNNRTYYNSESHQATIAKMRARPEENTGIGTRILDPVVDYAALARSYGVYGEGPIEDPGALRPALERAVRHVKNKKQPALLDVVTQPR